MARHPKIAQALDLQVYFCDPASPWQRGTKKHQRPAAPVLPQGHRPVRLPPRYLAYVADQLNTAPQNPELENPRRADADCCYPIHPPLRRPRESAKRQERTSTSLPAEVDGGECFSRLLRCGRGGQLARSAKRLRCAAGWSR